MTRCGYLAASALLLAGLGLTANDAFAAKDKDNNFDNQHMDPYLTGPANESKLIKDVRHHCSNCPITGCSTTSDSR